MAGTYSLLLRKDKGSRLTIEEMDGNLLYLQENGGGGGTVNIDAGQIAFGSEVGLTSSSSLTLRPGKRHLIFGDNNTISATDSNNISIIGGSSNSIVNASSLYAHNSGIFSGQYNSICQSIDSVILGGQGNFITQSSHGSFILGAGGSNVSYNSYNSGIAGGSTNNIFCSN